MKYASLVSFFLLTAPLMAEVVEAYNLVESSTSHYSAESLHEIPGLSKELTTAVEKMLKNSPTEKLLSK